MKNSLTLLLLLAAGFILASCEDPVSLTLVDGEQLDISKVDDDYWDDFVYELPDGEEEDARFAHGLIITVDEGATASITGGFVTNELHIQQNASLFMEEGSLPERGDLNFLVDWPNEKIVEPRLTICMDDGSYLHNRTENIYLGSLNVSESASVTIHAGDLLAYAVDTRVQDPGELTCPREFFIDGSITLENTGSVLVMDREYTKSVTIRADQYMGLNERGSLRADDLGPFIYQDGTIDLAAANQEYYRTHLDSDPALEQAAKLVLPDDSDNYFDSYLGGTATISLGTGTGLYGVQEHEPDDEGRSHVSWLTNNIEVRGTGALMSYGYYGGNITMQEDSSLKFDMLVAPAGVDKEHWNGGVKVDMNGGNTLDLAGRHTTLDLTVRGDGNTIAKGGTFAGTAVITNGSLALPVDVDDHAEVFLLGNATLDLGGGEHSWTPAYSLTVEGTGNTLRNGYFIGTLLMEENSYLYSDSAMASWNGPASIVMDEGSKLEMATGAGKDRWINDVSKLVVNGTATVVNAYLRIKPGETYTLGNGVQNLVGLERSFLSLDNSTLDLGNGEISKLAIGVWSAFDPYNNVIKNGKINSYVEIDPSAKLSLRGVTIGDNASFTMKDNTLLDLGQAKEEYMVTVQTPLKTESWLATRNGIGLNKFTFTGQSARIDNGTLWVGDHISGDNETVTLGTDLSGTAAMKLDYDQATLKFGGHKWTMTQSNGTELFTMEDNGGYTGAITGRAEIDVDAGTQDKNRVQFKGKAADRPDWVQVQGVKLTTKSDFYMENAVISGSLIDIGEGTTMYLVNVEIKADTRFTDDTAMLDMRNTTAWLEQDVNTYVTGREQMETDTDFSWCGDIWAPRLTIAEGSKGINLTCDMFDSVTLDGTDLWLDMTDIAERGTLLGWDYFTLTFDSMTQEVEQALTYIRNLQIFAKLGEDYITNAYVSYSDYAEHDDRASRLFFKLVPTPEPATGTLSLLGLGLLAGRRRRHN